MHMSILQAPDNEVLLSDGDVKDLSFKVVLSNLDRSFRRRYLHIYVSKGAIFGDLRYKGPVDLSSASVILENRTHVVSSVKIYGSNAVIIIKARIADYQPLVDSGVYCFTAQYADTADPYFIYACANVIPRDHAMHASMLMHSPGSPYGSDSREIRTDDTFSLECFVGGMRNATVALSMIKDGETDATPVWSTRKENYTYRISVNNSYRRASPADSGTYICSARGEGGQYLEQQWHLKVL